MLQGKLDYIFNWFNSTLSLDCGQFDRNQKVRSRIVDLDNIHSPDDSCRTIKWRLCKFALTYPFVKSTACISLRCSSAITTFSRCLKEHILSTSLRDTISQCKSCPEHLCGSLISPRLRTKERPWKLWDFFFKHISRQRPSSRSCVRAWENFLTQFHPQWVHARMRYNFYRTVMHNKIFLMWVPYLEKIFATSNLITSRRLVREISS